MSSGTIKGQPITFRSIFDTINDWPLGTQSSQLTSSSYINKNTSFSGCDIRATIKVGDKIQVIGNLATLSYSIHREKFPVRALGFTFPKGVTRGPRTIAGTMVFNVFDRYALSDVMGAKGKLDRVQGDVATAMLGDQMLPFDVTCTFINELGVYSQLAITGIELIDEGQVMSINDIYIESTHSYIATGISVLHSGPALKEALNS
jgi:hypothetical protein